MSLGSSRTRQLRTRTNSMGNALRGMVRRLSIGRTAANGLWQLLGLDGLDTDDEDEPERETFDDCEVFPGVGVYGRPPEGTRAEVVVVNVGGKAGHPVVIATRDKATQVELEADETAIFNSTSVVKIKADGTIEIGARTGGSMEWVALGETLATFLAQDKTWKDTHVHPTPMGPSSVPTVASPSVPDVTSSKVKVEV